jgi:hypothetical protein
MLSAYISELDVGFSDKDIWEYILGSSKEGESISDLNTSFTFQTQQKNTIRRLLTNIPYLLKRKGTRAAIKGLIKSYGIPESTLSITEFGNIQTEDGVEENSNTIVTDTRILSIPKSSGKNIFVDDDKIAPVKAIEFNYQWDKTNEEPAEVVVVSGSNPNNTDQHFNIKLVPTEDTSGKIQLTITSGSVSTEATSSAAPIYNENFWNVLVQQKETSGGYEIYLNDFNRERRVFDTQTFDATFINDPNIEIGLDNAFKNSYEITVGNDGTQTTFYGFLDEFRIWSAPLTQTDFDEHTKFPFSVRLTNPLQIPGDLKVRVDIEKEPSDDSIANNTLPNLVFNPLYNNTVDTNNLQINDFVFFERDDIVLSPVIGTEKKTDNKVRYQIQNSILGGTLTSPLDSRNTSAELLPDISDTNDLVIGFTPSQIVDQIILQHFGSTNLIDEYGDPTEANSDEYQALTNLVENFFTNININYKVKFFTEYIRNFDKTLFNNIEKFVPEKANLSTSIFIEPHLLDRSKAKQIANPSEVVNLANNDGIAAQGGPGSDQIIDITKPITDFNQEGTIGVIDPTESFVGDLFNITIGNNAEAIITSDEISFLLSQNTQIILIKDGFEEQLLQNIYPADENMQFRVTNEFGESFIFEFRKFVFDSQLETIKSQIALLDPKDNSNQEYVDLTAKYKELKNLNGRLFLIRADFSGQKPGVRATFEDFAEFVRTIIGEGAVIGDTIVINGVTYAIDPDGGPPAIDTFEQDGVACIKIQERSDGVSLTVE